MTNAAFQFNAIDNAYATTKAAVNGFSASPRQQVTKQYVRVDVTKPEANGAGLAHCINLMQNSLRGLFLARYQRRQSGNHGATAGHRIGDLQVPGQTTNLNP